MSTVASLDEDAEFDRAFEQTFSRDSARCPTYRPTTGDAPEFIADVETTVMTPQPANSATNKAPTKRVVPPRRPVPPRLPWRAENAAERSARDQAPPAVDASVERASDSFPCGPDQEPTYRLKAFDGATLTEVRPGSFPPEPTCATVDSEIISDHDSTPPCGAPPCITTIRPQHSVRVIPLTVDSISTWSDPPAASADGSDPAEFNFPALRGAVDGRAPAQALSVVPPPSLPARRAVEGPATTVALCAPRRARRVGLWRRPLKAPPPRGGGAVGLLVAGMVLSALLLSGAALLAVSRAQRPSPPPAAPVISIAVPPPAPVRESAATAAPHCEQPAAPMTTKAPITPARRRHSNRRAAPLPLFR